MVDECTKKTLSSIPLLQTRAGPRDKDIWVQRLKEEYLALIKVNPTVGQFGHCFIYALLFTFYLSFSMCKTIKKTVQIGSIWNPIKRVQSGLENAGTCTISLNMSSM